MYSCKIELSSLAETSEFSKFLSQHISPGGLVGLRGSLGVGKTALVRECLRALGVKEDICSPTFVLEAVYLLPLEARFKRVFHWDLYRIRDDIFDGDLLESVGNKDSLTFVEWPEKVLDINQQLTVDIFIDFKDNLSEARKLTINVVEDSALEEALKRRYQHE